MKRIVAWLGEKTLTRAEVLLMIATLLALQYLPAHPAIEILGWVIAALLAFLAVIFGWALWTLKRRRK